MKPPAYLLMTTVLAALLAGCTAPPPGYDEGSIDADGESADVEMKDIKFAPDTLTVGVGTTVTWTNRDPFGHTVTPTDADQWGTEGSGDAAADWLGKGGSWSFTFADPGTYGYYCIPHASLDGRGGAVGMTGTIIVTASGAEESVDTLAVPDPVAPARTLPGADGVVHLALETREVVAQLADGASYEFWTFNGTVPGPMLRVREGDAVELTLRNAAESQHPHSIDLHAVTGPGGGAKATQTEPGEETSFTFQALNPGLYVYHCATPHVPTHVANGMYGLILVEPESGMPEVDKEFYVVQGELYTDEPVGTPGRNRFSAEKMMAEDAEYFLLNGRVGALTGDGALAAEVGDTVRIYFGVGGFVPSSFHVIGEIFDRVYPEGGFPAVENVQTTLVPAGGATMVEFQVEVPGTYLLVDHWLTHAIDRGAAGQLVVSGEENEGVFRAG